MSWGVSWSGGRGSVSGAAGEGESCGGGARAHVRGNVVEWRVRGRGVSRNGVCVRVCCGEIWGVSRNLEAWSLSVEIVGSATGEEAWFLI